MKFLHTGDIHFGCCPEAGTPYATERREAIRNILMEIVDLANVEDVDLLLIAGDLFHERPTKSELKEVAYYLSKLRRAQVVMIAGNHDYLSEDSPYKSYNFGKHVVMLNSQKMSRVYLKDIDTEVYGFSYYAKMIKEPLYDNISVPQDGRTKILLAHGGDADHIPISRTALADSGFDYIALGHIHAPEMVKGSNIAFCGSPEPIDRTETGSHGCILGNIDGGRLTLMWHPLAQLQYRIMDITPGSDATMAAIEDLVKSAIATHPGDLFTVNIVGERPADLEIDTGIISRIDRVCHVSDTSVPEYDLDELARNHKNDLISLYINELNTPDATKQMKDALYAGLKALLKD